MSELTSEFKAIFRPFLLVLLGIEPISTLKVYLTEDEVHVEVVFAVALIGVGRKAIILDVEKISSLSLLGIASIIISLSIDYFLVKRTFHGKGLQDPEKQGVFELNLPCPSTPTFPLNEKWSRIAVEWEREALKAKDKGARVVITRFGIVMGEKGGALSQMIPLFKKYIGGPIGSGKQWFSWIHIKDLAEAFAFLLKHPEISGPVNVCSPSPVRNKDLAKALGKALHKPSFVPAPGFMIRLVLGEFGSVILKGQRVVPRKLLENGFVFQYADIDKALQSIV